jgi:hypothetical protein
VENGKLRLTHRGRFDQAISELFKGNVLVTVEKETRSLAQNALLAVWVDQIAQELGWDHDYTRWYIKDTFNRKHGNCINKETGEVVEVSWPGDTHDLPKDAFSELLERIQRGFAEQGVQLLWPDELKTITQEEDNGEVAE